MGVICGFSLCVDLSMLSAKPLQGTAGAKTNLESVDTAFQNKILPLFDRNCLVCHGSTVQRAGLDLRTTQSALRGSANGPVIRPGNAQQSLLYQLITHH